MSYKIRKAAVLGAGVMGSKIAAHFANAGIPVYLLDIPPRELTDQERTKGFTLDHPAVRNRIVNNGLDDAKKSKPAAFFVPEYAGRITTGNFEDNMKWVGEVDWIIEAVVERFDIKQQLFEKVEQYRKPGTIVTSNTSGIPIHTIAEGRSDDFRRHFLGTHFFNPPRYLRLLEIIRTPETNDEVVGTIVRLGEDVLGRGIVYSNDVPNFIANRIGIFSMMYAVKVMMDEHYTIEEVDQLTGTIIGRPKSATFRTADLVGLDTFVHVANNLYESVPDDERREIFKIPDLVGTMLEKKMLGDKTKQGFYKKVKENGESKILTLDLRALDYRERQKASFPSVEMYRNTDDVKERIVNLVYSKDRAGQYLWKVISETLIYTANRLPEITEDIRNVDNAMKWGFGWELGPFEYWDTIGLEKSVATMKDEGKQVPDWIEQMLESGISSFYKIDERGNEQYYDFNTKRYVTIEERPGFIALPTLKRKNKTLASNAGASIIDIGDGVLNLEFHAKMNAIGPDMIQMMNTAVRMADEKGYEGVVVANHGPNFSVGANLMMILMEAQDENWEELDTIVRAFQNANMNLRYSPKPVVVAPHAMTLGGGCEVTLHGDAVQASAETYIGLVELGVGVIPAGGGTKEFLLRMIDPAADTKDVDLFPYVRRAFETIGMAKVATSAVEAKKLGFLREDDGVTMNADKVIYEAKQRVLALAKTGYRMSAPRTDIPVLGKAAYANLLVGLYLFREGNYISEYDEHIAKKLAYVLSGGNFVGTQYVSEQYLLDLEREAFLSLLGERKTQERMAHMLKKGKPLRN
jgi:3-hydroxyacyl-CoA dehydrogenase